MNTRPNTAAIFTFILGVTIAVAGPSFADLVRGDIVVFGDGATLTATDLNNNFDVLADAIENLDDGQAANTGAIDALIAQDVQIIESDLDAVPGLLGSTQRGTIAPLAVHSDGGSNRGAAAARCPDEMVVIGGHCEGGGWVVISEFGVKPPVGDRPMRFECRALNVAALADPPPSDTGGTVQAFAYCAPEGVTFTHADR